jgi:ectoine hydroxylase-related dioxygenase (phytanoyl-CoA dioxygenase family)
VGLSTVEQSEVAAAIEHDGFVTTGPVVPQLTVDRLAAEVSGISDPEASRGGIRNLFELSAATRELATSAAVRQVAESVLGPHCFAVRAILFDKTAAANWKVVWHQDLTIAVRARVITAGFGPWTEKAGVTHVQPPIEILERMLAVRVHLDDCGPDNGPVRVLPRSHRVGRLSASAIEAWQGGSESVECVADRGAILAFRPLILHASSRATVPGHRRVIHIDFAAEELPPPLEWYERFA